MQFGFQAPSATALPVQSRPNPTSHTAIRVAAVSALTYRRSDQTAHPLETLYGEAVKIPITEEQYFLLCNHQNTEYDEILNGRGLAIWHIMEIPYSYTSGCVTSRHIIDLEHRLGMWEHTDLCADYPRAADCEEGADSLDCVSNMIPHCFYGGLAPAAALVPKEFAPETNPCSHAYDVETAERRRDPQADSTGIGIRSLGAKADPNATGKYIIYFDVEFED